jgi:hypothetical protein
MVDRRRSHSADAKKTNADTSATLRRGSSRYQVGADFIRNV